LATAYKLDLFIVPLVTENLYLTFTEMKIRKLFILVFLSQLTISSAWSQTQVDYFAEVGPEQISLYRTKYHFDKPQARTLFQDQPRMKFRGIPTIYLSGRVVLSFGSIGRNRIYSGFTWSPIKTVIEIQNLPDSIHSGANPTVHVKQESFRFYLGYERHFLGKPKCIVQLGLLADYLGNPNFEAQEPIFVNSRVNRQLVMGAQLGLGIYVPKTIDRLLLRYNWDFDFTHAFALNVKQEFKSDIEYYLFFKHSYHQVGLSYLIH